MNLINKSLVMAMVAVGFAGTAIADTTTAPALLRRCADDSLDTPQALGRIAWAEKCIAASGGSWQGLSAANIINYRMEIGADMRVTPRSRPNYPTFAAGDTTWVAPIDPAAGCDVPAGYSMVATCVASCYTPDQKLLYKDGYTVLFDAFRASKQGLMVLSERATLEQPELRESATEYTTEAVDTKNEVVEVRTATGGSVRVTLNHPLMTSEGKLVEAGKLKIGDELAMADGKSARITELVHSIHYGKVYNVSPEMGRKNGEYDLKGQIVVAQGFLSGANFFQNHDAEYMNRVGLRRNAPVK